MGLATVHPLNKLDMWFKSIIRKLTVCYCCSTLINMKYHVESWIVTPSFSFPHRISILGEDSFLPLSAFCD